MHVLLLSARIPPTVDGVGDYTAFLAASLVRRDVRVTLTCGKQDRYTPPDGVTLWPDTLGHARKDAKEWVRQVVYHQPDWLLLQYVPYAFQRWGLPFFLPSLLQQVRAAGIRVGVMFHEVHIRPRENSLLSFGQRRIAQQLSQNADVVLTSIPFYQHMLACLGVRAHVLPVGANISDDMPDEGTRQQLRQSCLPNKQFVISTFGRRNFSAIAAAIASWPDTGLLIVGQSSANRLGSEVYTTGCVAASEVGMWLRCGDIFVLPDPRTPDGTGGTSLKSGSLAAAFAAGLPVIGVTGDLTAPPLAHGENIWLIDDPTPTGWAKAIAHLRSEPYLRQYLAEGGHKLYQQHLHWDVISAQLLQILNG